MSQWVCYLIASLDSNNTYIGSTNNPRRRLCDHNNQAKSRRGAKRTRGQTWIPIIRIRGFIDKNACLSFESGWKRLSRVRRLSKFENYEYCDDAKWNRLVDLLYFLHHIAVNGNHYKLDRKLTKPDLELSNLSIEIVIEDWIAELPWPEFINCS
jgi:predicted GIY-YIG superfamily endonuclease